MPETLIALGANLGAKSETLSEAVAFLKADPRVQLVAQSRPLETKPIGVPDSRESFINAAARFRVTYTAEEWLNRLLAAEQALGRQRTVRWGARKIDLDLLLFGDEIIDSEPLLVPHPRMGFRRFVMQPAAEIAGDMRHPLYDCSLERLWDHLNRQPNWLVWQCQSEAEYLQARQLSFDVPVRRWCYDAQASSDQDIEAHFQWLLARPVSGDSALTLLLCVAPGASTDVLMQRCLAQVEQPKLCIRRRHQSSLFDREVVLGRRALDGEPVKLELVLNSEDPDRTAQEVRGAVESIVAL